VDAFRLSNDLVIAVADPSPRYGHCGSEDLRIRGSGYWVQFDLAILFGSEGWICQVL